MLFTVGEVSAADCHLTNQKGTHRQALGLYIEGDGGGAAGLHGDRLFLFQYDGVGLGVEESEYGRPCEVFLTGIEDTGGDRGHIAFAQEARHVGLNHHILLGHRQSLDGAVAQILRMG